MLKSLTAYTYQLDHFDLAIAEILEQLNLAENLQKNSVGIITCYNEFIENGLVAALAQALPFDIVGCSTLGNATAGQNGPMMLALMVLTGDDIQFKTAFSEPLIVDPQQAVENAYHRVADADLGPAAVILSFFPLNNNFVSGNLCDYLQNIAAPSPIFGLFASNFENFSQNFCLHNQQYSDKSFSLLAIYGNIKTDFFLTSIPSTNIQKQNSIITASQNNILQEINNLTLEQYTQSIGLGGGNNIITSIPFVADFKDGNLPLARAIFSINDQGYAVCGSLLPPGTTLALGYLEYEDVLQTADSLISQALAKNGQALILFPCKSRNAVLGPDAQAELEFISQKIGSSLPYLIAYAAGEICPIDDKQGNLLTRYHNYSLIGLLLS